MRKFISILVPISLLLRVQLAVASEPVNLGLVGVGRIPADSFDFIGARIDTLGGTFSGMALDLRNVSHIGNTHSTTLYALPDRGFGDGTNDYHNRIHTFTLGVTPYAGPFPAPAQDQIQLALANTMLFTINGATFTGFNPNDTNVANFPQSTANGPGMGHRSLDSEGVALASDGGFFVADEYGPFIYRFDFIGEFEYELHPPDAYIPKSGAVFGSRFPAYGTEPAQVATNDSGRFYNRGFEGASLTPDGKKLVAILQVPLQQDGENRNTSRNTRILVFNVDSTSAQYKQPIAEYIYELTLEGSEAKNRNTPVSELLALSDTEFLVLERESRGRGGDPGPILYKKVVKADIKNATNLLGIPGTPYDLEKGAPGQLSLPRSGLPAGIVAAARTELVDLADKNQLAKFGLNVNTNWDNNTISEKWEGLAVLPLNDPNAPGDYLLLVGNDNDFRASTVYHNGVVVGTNAITIDSMMLAFRIGADTNPPALTCPLSATILAGPGCTFPDLSSVVIVTDNSAGPITLLQNPAAGTPVALQTPVPVIVSAVDASGNASQPCSFTVVVFSPPPTIQCPTSITNAVGPDCLATIPDFTTNAVVSGACGVVSVTQEPAPGAIVSAGSYTITLTATDSGGQSNTCSTGFTALGDSAPLSVTVTPSRDTLWPPNHKMARVTLNVSAVGGCSAIQQCEIISVTSNEPIMGQGDTTSPDWQITGPLSLKLRAERSGNIPDRIYTIQIRCGDAAGNSITASTTVTVPHDQRGTSP